MNKKKTNEKRDFLGLVEMNESQEREVKGGYIIIGYPETIKDIMIQCCGLIILADFPPMF